MRLTLPSVLILFLTLASASVVRSQSVQLVPAYAYHLKPPFILDITAEKGLYFDLSTVLSTPGKIEFYTVFVPRKRIERMLESKKLDGIIIGVNPTWFGDLNENKYHWSPAFFHDRDEFISLPKNHFEYVDDESLQGHILAGVRGFYYHHVESLVRNNNMQRIDTIGEHEVLQLILRERADIGIVSRSTFDYLRTHEHPEFNLLHVSTKPHDSFARRILIMPENKELAEYIDTRLQSEDFRQRWQAVLDSYAVKNNY
ncbi:ABC transporter substrate-binding protein [Bowmanella sp. JS7-9]|uniref:Substrate-binding periplasmic protein n=1 Tax=Pseudobowmanella zhangzhouensis TaxID=1537679 RepID=A0ABW1XN15_9ALTE|nr:hypothetical protein [Bowmanella sp. JS7-9]